MADPKEPEGGASKFLLFQMIYEYKKSLNLWDCTAISFKEYFICNLAQQWVAGVIERGVWSTRTCFLSGATGFTNCQSLGGQANPVQWIFCTFRTGWQKSWGLTELPKWAKVVEVKLVAQSFQLDWVAAELCSVAAVTEQVEICSQSECTPRTQTDPSAPDATPHIICLRENSRKQMKTKWLCQQGWFDKRRRDTLYMSIYMWMDLKSLF